MQTSMHSCGASTPPQSWHRQRITVSADESSSSSRPPATGLSRRSAERADCRTAWYPTRHSPGPGSVRASSLTTALSPSMRTRQAAAAAVSSSYSPPLTSSSLRSRQAPAQLHTASSPRSRCSPGSTGEGAASRSHYKPSAGGRQLANARPGLFLPGLAMSPRPRAQIAAWPGPGTARPGTAGEPRTSPAAPTGVVAGIPCLQAAEDVIRCATPRWVRGGRLASMGIARRWRR